MKMKSVLLPRSLVEVFWVRPCVFLCYSDWWLGQQMHLQTIDSFRSRNVREKREYDDCNGIPDGMSL